MSERDRVNALTADLVREVGHHLAQIGDFAAEMVCLEGLAAGLIAANAIRFNRHPEEITEAFCAGLRERVTAANIAFTS